MSPLRGRPNPRGATWDDRMFGYRIGSPEQDLAVLRLSRSR